MEWGGGGNESGRRWDERAIKSSLVHIANEYGRDGEGQSAPQCEVGMVIWMMEAVEGEIGTEIALPSIGRGRRSSNGLAPTTRNALRTSRGEL